MPKVVVAAARRDNDGRGGGVDVDVRDLVLALRPGKKSQPKASQKNNRDEKRQKEAEPQTDTCGAWTPASLPRLFSLF